MKEQFHIVLITVGLFAAGLLMGIWTQRTRPIPAPPAPVLGEFFPPPAAGMGAGYAEGGFGAGRFSREHPGAVVAMNRKIAELEPKIRAFRDAIDAIERDFRVKLDRLLTVEQRQKLAAMEAEEGPHRLARIPVPPGLADAPGFFAPGREAGEHIVVGFPPPFPIGGWLMMSMIIYQPSLGHLSSELKLDASQQAAVTQLMIERRTQLLALIDKNPPPSLGFGDALP